MAESCADCGKTLTFRDSFEWKGKKLCKSCLTSHKEETQKTKDGKKKKGKKEVLSLEKMNKDIKQWGIALIVLGVIHLIASEFLDATWGIIIIILGIVNLFVRKKEMFIANGIALIVVGIMNIISGIEGGGRWAVFGIMQLVWGGQEINKYSKYKNLFENTQSGTEDLEPGKCPTCGIEIKEGSRTCPQCGAAVHETDTAEQPKQYQTEVSENKDVESAALPCENCAHYDSVFKVCAYFHFNVESYPKKYHQKCNSKYFTNRSA